MPATWDSLRAKTRGIGAAGLPRCSRCKRPRVMDPCRDCATPTELAATRPHPYRPAECIPVYPPLDHG